MVVRELHDDGLKLLGCDEPGARQHVELAVRALDTSRGQLDILGPERVFHVLDREIVRGEPLAIDPDPHRVAALAIDRDVRDAVEVLEPVDEEAVDVVRDLERRQLRARQHDHHDGLRIGLDLGDDRLVDLVG